MGKGKNNSGGASAASTGDAVVELDPAVIYFTFSRIRPCFSCGRTIQSTMDEMLARTLTPADLPLLCVFTDGTHYYSQNNRRLFVYKELRRQGVLTTVPVRLRPLPSTRRMQHKYTPAKCALTATLMGNNNGNNNNKGSDNDSCCDVENGGPSVKQDGNRARAASSTPADDNSSEGSEEERSTEASSSTTSPHASTAHFSVGKDAMSQAAPATGNVWEEVDSLASEGNAPAARGAACEDDIHTASSHAASTKESAAGMASSRYANYTDKQLTPAAAVRRHRKAATAGRESTGKGDRAHTPNNELMAAGNKGGAGEEPPADSGTSAQDRARGVSGLRVASANDEQARSETAPVASGNDKRVKSGSRVARGGKAKRGKQVSSAAATSPPCSSLEEELRALGLQ